MLELNPASEGAWPTKTLAELRQAIFDSLGFLAAFDYSSSTRTLSDLLDSMYSMLGMAAQAGSPLPGSNQTLIDFLNHAEQTLARRLELSRTTPPPRMVNLSDSCTLDAQAVLTLAVGLAKANRGDADAKVYFDESERWLAGEIQRRPPNAMATINGFLRNAQERLYRRYELFRMERWFTWTLVAGQRFYSLTGNDNYRLATPTIVSVTGIPVIDGSPSLSAGTYSYRVSAYVGPTNRSGESAASVAVTASAIGPAKFKIAWAPVVGAAGYNVYGRVGGNEKLLVTADSPSTTEFIDDGLRTPSGALPADSTGDTSSRRIDPRKINWVGVSDGSDNSWRPLRKGIPPGLFGSPVEGVPTHYDLRQALEVWPAPVAGWKLRVKGDFGLDPFDADGDSTTIDWQAVFFQALADAKAFYKQADVQIAVEQARVYLGDLVAGTHMTARYVSGECEPAPAVRPVLVS